MKIAFNPSTVAALTAPPNNKDITFDLRGQNIFARGVKFCGTDTNTWRDIKINNVSIDSNTLDLRDGDNTTLTNTNGVVTINSTWRPVVDNLTSDSTTSSLSANLGRVLKSLIDGKSDSGHTHDDRYLRLTGGWMSGDINFGGDNKIYWGRNSDSASISFKNDGDGDADSYMSFVTSDNGNEYFRWSHSSGSTNTEWMALRSDGLRVGGTKVSLEGHSHNDLYYTKTEVNNKLNGKSDTSHTHDDRYLKLAGGTMTGIISATNRGGTWISGRDHCLIRSDDKTSSSYWSAILAIATVNGYWTLGHLGDGGERIGFNYDTDADYNAGRNNNHVIWLPTGGAEGTLALTSDIPTSLKNPYALTISLNGTSQGPYDGSAAKSINITPSSIGAATSDHNHDGRYVYNYGGTANVNGLALNQNALFMSTTSSITEDWWHILQAAWNGEYRWNSLIAFPTLNRNGMYYRSGLDDNTAWGSWVKLLDVNNYSSTLDSRYYTESEVNSLLDAKLNRQNLSYGTWNPRDYNLAADYLYNGGDLSISESGGLIHVSVDGYFWLNEGLYRVLDTSDVAGLKNNLTVHLYLSNTDTTWWPLIWGGSSHNNTSDSTGEVYKSHNKLSWLTSSLTLYATNIQTENIKHLSIGGGIYWNPYVELTTDSSDAASITLVKSGVAGGTTLVLSLMNDANDTILFQTNGSAKLYHNSYPILTALNTYVNNNKGYIYGNEITLVNNADTVDGYHATDGRTFTGNINWSPNWNDTWSDGTHTHPWYGFDHRYENTGAYSTTITDYFGMTIKTQNTLRLDFGTLLLNSGNVGIGTTSPVYKLHVNGNIYSSGQIIREGHSTIWILGRDVALLRETTAPGYHTLWSLKTTNGSWDFGEYNTSGWNNVPVLSYITDSNYNSGNNTTTYQIKFPLASGTVALTSFGGDSSHPIFLGYLNLDHGNEGTVSSSFYCLGYSVPFTYTRGGNYCRIYIPDTSYQTFYIRAAIASVNYSGGGMDTWTGERRGDGAWWLHCYASGLNEVRVKGFCLRNSNNDSWWGGNPLWSGSSGANRITVCIFGNVTIR